MPKLQMIDGRVKHYAYTPAGKKQYQQDKANQLGAEKMQPSLKGHNNDDGAGLPYVYTYPNKAKRPRPKTQPDQSKRRKPPVQYSK